MGGGGGRGSVGKIRAAVVVGLIFLACVGTGFCVLI